MPDTKKRKKRVSGNTAQPKKLRQTTLFESAASSPDKSLDVPSRQKHITPRKLKKEPGYVSSGSSDIGAIKLEPVTPAKDPADQDDRSQSPLPSRVKRRRLLVIETETDEERYSSSSESNAMIKPKHRRLRRSAAKNSSSSREGSVPSQRLSTRGEKANKDTTDSERDEDLTDEIDKDYIVESRMRARGKQTPFQKNLERLKRKRTGQPTLALSSSDDSEEGEEDQTHFKTFKGARPPDSEAGVLSNDSTDDSSDFIIEDDSQAVVAQLPTEFSMRSHDDLSHQFKIIFQFFVHIAVRPTPHRHAFMEGQIKNQEYFSVPLKVTRRKLFGIQDSLASSVWLPEFKKALRKYPTFELNPLDFVVPSCDACRLGGRLSTLTGRLGGIPYDSSGFRETTNSSDEDMSHGPEGFEGTFKKSKFGFIEFHLGRFCARRTRTYHEFSHWEYHLFNSIRSEIDDLRAARSKKGFVRIAFAGGKQPPDDLTDADGICEWLDERGLVDQEWHKLKVMMENAERLEASAGKGEED